MEKEVTENAGTAFQESSGPDVKKGCETVTLLKKSEGFDAPVDPGPNAVKEEADKVGRESKESNNNTPSEEPEGDDQINNDHGEGSDESDENESDLEVIITRVAKKYGQLSAVSMYNLSLSDKILSVLGRDDLVNQIPKTIVLTLFRIKYGTLVN